MAANVAVTYNFTAGTPAVADDVDTNFSDLVTWINTNAVHLDGSKAFANVPSGPASDPTTGNQFTRKAYVDAQLDARIKVCTSSTRPSPASEGMVIYETDTDKIMVYNSSSWVFVGPSLVSSVRNTSDQSSTSTSLTAVTGLSFAVQSGKSYMVKFHGFFTSSATSTGFKVGLVSPPTMTACRLYSRIATGGTTFEDEIGSESTVFTSAGVSTTSGVFQYILEGVVTPSTNGTIQLGFGSEVAGSSVTHKAYAVGTCTVV